MLMDGARNLTGLDFTALNDLRANLGQTRALIQQAEGLAFEVSNLDSRFRQLYPQAIAPGTTGAALASQAPARRPASLHPLRPTMPTQPEVAGVKTANERRWTWTTARATKQD